MIFIEQVSRKPDHYPWVQDYINAMWSGHWTPNEFNFQSDVQNFKTDLSDDERRMVTRTLSAIGQIEIAVKKFWANLGENLPHPSLADLGYVMASIETIHNIAYEKLLNSLGLQDVFEENLKLDIIQGRVNYLRKYANKCYTDSKKQYVYALALFTLFVENVSLFSQFYIILWLNRYKNVLKDTAQQVQYTRLEEALHAQAGIKIIQTIRSEHPELFDEELESRIVEEAREAYNAESKIVEWMVGDFNEKGLNADILKEYIKSRINESLESIGFSSVFETDKKLLEETYWMEEELFGNTSTDFFHKRPVEYSKNNLSFNEDDLF